MQKGDVFGVVIVVALLVGVGAFFAYAPKATRDVYAPVEVTGSAVTLGTQVDDRSVVVSAELKQAGFVTVHQAFGDAPGPVVGHSPLLAVGSHPEISIETTEPLRPGAGYFVLMFVDDGDSVYEAGTDLPVMSDGQVVKQKLEL
jgi:hypothetical protein